MTDRTEPKALSKWRRFWERGGWWRALLLTVVYLVIYNAVGLALNGLFGSFVDPENLFANGESVFFGLALPILVGGALPMILFAASLGWLSRLFGPQPLGARKWMWIAVPLVLLPIILRVLGTDWGSYGAGVIISMVAVGIAVGFAEEFLTRGLAVDLLRKAGHGERTVAVLSSLIFALLHSSNLLAGMPVLTVLITIVYTFGFGMMMYLVLRVTGRLIWPMLLHGLTDPTTMLATGGLDAHGTTAGSSPLIALAGTFNVVYPLLGAIVLIFISGRAHDDAKRPL